MRKIFAGIALLPCVAFAATDCRVVEYPDHFEAVCVGDAKTVPAATNTATPAQFFATSQADTEARSGAATANQSHGKRRPPASAMDAAKAFRSDVMREQLRKETDSKLSHATQD